MAWNRVGRETVRRHLHNVSRITIQKNQFATSSESILVCHPRLAFHLPFSASRCASHRHIHVFHAYCCPSIIRRPFVTITTTTSSSILHQCHCKTRLPYFRKTTIKTGPEKRWKSSNATATSPALDAQTDLKSPKRQNNAEEEQEPHRDPLDLSFQDAEAAYKSKSTFEILRALLVFQLCSNEYLVDNNMQVSVW